MKTLLDDNPLTFGKFAGETPEEISEHDPSYIVWCHENLDKRICTNNLYEKCKLIEDENDFEADKELDDFYSFNGW